MSDRYEPYRWFSTPRRWADVVAAPLVPVEVRAREGVVVAVALVAHRDVPGDLLVPGKSTQRDTETPVDI